MNQLNGGAVCCGADGSWTADVVVKLRDQDGNQVSGATVTGLWTGGYGGPSQATSNPGGNANFGTPPLIGSSPVAFTVLSITHPEYQYDSSQNSASAVTINSPI